MATTEMPDEFEGLIAWLEAERYTRAGADTGGEPGRHARWVNGDMQVRIGREHDDWFTDLCCRAWGGTWHDAHVVLAALEHRDVSAPITWQELVLLVRQNLASRLSVPARDTRLAEELEALEKTMMRTQLGL